MKKIKKIISAIIFLSIIFVQVACVDQHPERKDIVQGEENGVDLQERRQYDPLWLWRNKRQKRKT